MTTGGAETGRVQPLHLLLVLTDVLARIRPIALTPAWLAMMISVALSSIVAVSIIGYILVQSLRASGFKAIAESQGLKTYLD